MPDSRGVKGPKRRGSPKTGSYQGALSAYKILGVPPRTSAPSALKKIQTQRTQRNAKRLRAITGISEISAVLRTRPTRLGIPEFA